MNPGQLPHLARRFFESLRAHRPAPADQLWVGEMLDPAAARLFFAQDPMDQSHALHVARRVAAAAPERNDLVQAALLHDVGKGADRLGVAGRSLATLLAIAHLPASRRMRRYLDHGAIGAEALAAAGAAPLTVGFARSHHQRRPPAGIAPGDWETLYGADSE